MTFPSSPTTNSSAPSKIIFCSVWLAGRHSGIGFGHRHGLLHVGMLRAVHDGLGGLDGRRRRRSRRRLGLGALQALAVRLRIWPGRGNPSRACADRSRPGRRRRFPRVTQSPDRIPQWPPASSSDRRPPWRCCSAGARRRAATACAPRRRTSEGEASTCASVGLKSGSVCTSSVTAAFASALRPSATRQNTR